MKHYTPIEKLDHILNYLKKHKNSGPSENLDKEVFQVLDIHKYDYQRILRKLHKDGYADNIGDLTYVISFDGELFHGYKKEEELKIFVTAYLEADEILRSRNERLIVRGTWTASIVGALILLWYIFSWFCPHPSACFC